MKDRCIFAYTAPGADFPDYLSINRWSGEIHITVRSHRAERMAEMILPQDKLDELIYALRTARINPLRGS